MFFNIHLSGYTLYMEKIFRIISITLFSIILVIISLIISVVAFNVTDSSAVEIVQSFNKEIDINISDIQIIENNSSGWTEEYTNKFTFRFAKNSYLPDSFPKEINGYTRTYTPTGVKYEKWWEHGSNSYIEYNFVQDIGSYYYHQE